MPVHGQDAEMMEQIERDVMRTHPDMHFFSGDDPTATTHREASRPGPRLLEHAGSSESETIILVACRGMSSERSLVHGN